MQLKIYQSAGHKHISLQHRVVTISNSHKLTNVQANSDIFNI